MRQDASPESTIPLPEREWPPKIIRETLGTESIFLSAQERAMMRMVAVALLVANFANVLCLVRYF